MLAELLEVLYHHPFVQPVRCSRATLLPGRLPGIPTVEGELQEGLAISHTMSPMVRNGMVLGDWATFGPRYLSKIEPFPES